MYVYPTFFCKTAAETLVTRDVVCHMTLIVKKIKSFTHLYLNTLNTLLLSSYTWLKIDNISYTSHLSQFYIIDI